MVLTLYMHPVSQPARAVWWALLATNTPCNVVRVDPGQKKEGGTRHPDYLAMYPLGNVPVIDCDGFVLGESGAILTFLADKFGWTSLYPEDAETRGRIHQYLHMHHSLVRPITTAHFAPVVRSDLRLSPDMVAFSTASAKLGLTTLEATLGKSAFVAGTPHPTIADIQAYCEVSQLSPKFFGLMDLAPFPNVRRWLDACEKIPGHAESHRALTKLVPIFHKMAEKAKAKAKL